jgi:hypothetical protein
MSRQLVIIIEVGLSLEGVSAMGLVDELEQLADLFHKKVISEQEFQELKEQLISRGSQRTEDSRAGAGLVWPAEQMKKAQAEKQVRQPVSPLPSIRPRVGRGGMGSRMRSNRSVPPARWEERGFGSMREANMQPRNRAFVGAGGVRFCPNCTKRVQKAANYCMTCGVLL